MSQTAAVKETHKGRSDRMTVIAEIRKSSQIRAQGCRHVHSPHARGSASDFSSRKNSWYMKTMSSKHSLEHHPTSISTLQLAFGGRDKSKQ